MRAPPPFPLLITALLLTGTAVQAQVAPPGYAVTRHIPVSGDLGWDYLAWDAAGRRLFVSHGAKVDVVDAATGSTVGDQPHSRRAWHRAGPRRRARIRHRWADRLHHRLRPEDACSPVHGQVHRRRAGRDHVRAGYQPDLCLQWRRHECDGARRFHWRRRRYGCPRRRSRVRGGRREGSRVREPRGQSRGGAHRCAHACCVAAVVAWHRVLEPTGLAIDRQHDRLSPCATAR